jgi:neutral ceramidase
MKLTLTLLVPVLFLTSVPATAGQASVRAGAATINITPRKGVPLGGYGGGKRRLKRVDLNPFNDHTFLVPSTGVLDPLFARALVLEQGKKKLCILTIDAIATEGDLVTQAVKKAQRLGFSVALESVLVCASHTHSGSGAVAKSLLWQLSAMDRTKRRVRDRLIERLARVLVKAEKSLAPASIGVGAVDLRGATRNRRAKLDKSIKESDIDPQLAVIRVDGKDGRAIATVWNFAIHGTMHGAGNSKFSADVMGLVNSSLSTKKHGLILFLNGSEGDMAPAGGAAAAKLIVNAIMELHGKITTSSTAKVQSISKTLELGRPKVTVNEGTLEQLDGDILGLKNFLKGRKRGLSVPLSKRFIESKVRLQAIRIGQSIIVSIPGEPIASLGQLIRGSVKELGFKRVLIAGLANNHVGYLLTEAEFKRGGYEATVSFFGPKAGQILRKECRKLAAQLNDKK